jgi:AcrR family transcriptional regulator
MNDVAAPARTVPAPKVPLTPRGIATRKRIINAAELEFGEKGFHAASVASITQRAGVGQGTFYLYFHSKEECFAALVEEIGHALRRHMAAAVGRSRTRLDGERLGLEAFLDFANQHRGLYRIVQESQFVDEPTFREYYQRIAHGYATALEQAASKGELAAGDAEVRAWNIMGIGHFLGLRYCLWQKKMPDEKVMEEVMGFIARGMGPVRQAKREAR